MNATTFMDMNASVPAGTFINEHTPVNDNARMLSGDDRGGAMLHLSKLSNLE